MTAIHQIAAGAAPRDAITNHLLASRDLFRSWGYESEIFAGAIAPDLAGEVHDARRYPAMATRDALAILHYSIDSVAFAVAAEHAERSAMHYHNITPAHLLWRHAPGIAIECAVGRRRLGGYAGRVVASCADSRFNAAELEEAGFSNPVPVGILRAAQHPPARGSRRPGPPRLLFVGRGVPNKAQHDLILALCALHEAGVPAELTLVGSWDAVPSYLAACRGMASDLGVAGALHIVGSVDDEALAEAYTQADVFVCLSDHEGYCVPVVEAMEFGLPIVAYDAGAVGETVGGAGLVLPDKRPSTVAEAVIEVTRNAALRAGFSVARAERLADLGPEAVASRLRAFLGTMVVQ